MLRQATSSRLENAPAEARDYRHGLQRVLEMAPARRRHQFLLCLDRSRLENRRQWSPMKKQDSEASTA